MDSDEPLAVVVEVRVEEANFVDDGNVGPVDQLHQSGIDADGLGQVAQIKLHVDCYGRRVEASSGTKHSVGLFEKGGIIGGYA